MTKILTIFATCSFLWLCCGPINAQSKRLEPEIGKLPREAVGYGDTEEKAKESAVKDAVEHIRKLMAMQNPSMVSYDVPEKDVRRWLEKGKPGKDFELEGPLNQRPLKTWVMPFRTDTDWWHEVVRQDRQARANQRHEWTARGLLGLTVLLLAAVGYVRLDEYTQRRYTAWLRLAGVGVAASVAAGLWYAFQTSW